MTSSADEPVDLTGRPDERAAQLARLQTSDLSAAWLRRQLEGAFQAWGADESELDVDVESRADF